MNFTNAVAASIENNLKEHLYNVGFGSDISIKKLAELIQKTGHTMDFMGSYKTRWNT